MDEELQEGMLNTACPMIDSRAEQKIKGFVTAFMSTYTYVCKYGRRYVKSYFKVSIDL